MAATVQELIKKSFGVYNATATATFKQKIDLIAYRFGTINDFLRAKRADFDNICFVGGQKSVYLTDKEHEKIEAFQQSGLLEANLNVQQNFVKVLTTEFINRQIAMIENLTLEKLNINPILAAALNLNNEQDLIRYYVYQASSRSMVTSVGFLVQNLLLYASEYVHEGKNDPLGAQTKWDLVVDKINQVKAYLEIKSGTNDTYLNEQEVLKQIKSNEQFANNCELYDAITYSPNQLKQYTDFVNFTLNCIETTVQKKAQTIKLSVA